jgi:hypothetical protein
MRLSGLCVVALFLLSSIAPAQHSSTNSGGSSGSGGGSHASSPGGSSSSGGSGGVGRSSGGGAGHGSGGGSSGGGRVSVGASTAHVSNPRGNPPASHVVGHQSVANGTRALHSNHELSRTTRIRTAQPEKRSFLSFLRHPFRKPEQRSVSNLRHRVCLKGPCQVCPTGQIAARGGCAGTVVTNQNRDYCFAGQTWNEGYCSVPTIFRDDCGGYRMAMEQQARRMESAEAARQVACANAMEQECLNATSAWQSEQNLYRELQNRYQRCQMEVSNVYSFGGHGYSGYLSGSRFDPLRIELDH